MNNSQERKSANEEIARCIVLDSEKTQYWQANAKLLITEALDQKDAIIEEQRKQIEKLRENIQDYKDTYDPVKSGLRADELHCACAFELQARIKVLEEALWEIEYELEFARVFSAKEIAKEALNPTQTHE